MQKKLIATLIVDHSSGPEVDGYQALAEHLAEEWEGLEIYFQDAERDEETAVTLSVASVETATG